MSGPEVVGLGAVTVRAGGRSAQLPTGTTVPIARLEDLARELARGDGRGSEAAGTGTSAPGGAVAGAAGPDAGGGPPPGGAGDAPSPLLEAVGRQQAAFEEAVGASDVPAAVRAVLELDRELEGWSWDTLQSDEQDRARSALRSLVVGLGELAEAGAGDASTVVAPFVEALLELRAAAREEGRWKEADSVRDRLVALGIEVRDTPAGSTWQRAG